MQHSCARRSHSSLIQMHPSHSEKPLASMHHLFVSARFSLRHLSLNCSVPTRLLSPFLGHIYHPTLTKRLPSHSKLRFLYLNTFFFHLRHLSLSCSVPTRLLSPFLGGSPVAGVKLTRALVEETQPLGESGRFESETKRILARAGGESGRCFSEPKRKRAWDPKRGVGARQRCGGLLVEGRRLLSRAPMARARHREGKENGSRAEPMARARDVRDLQLRPSANLHGQKKASERPRLHCHSQHGVSSSLDASMAPPPARPLRPTAFPAS